MIWFAKFDPTAVIKRLPEATVFMACRRSMCACWPTPSPAAHSRGLRQHAVMFVAGSAPLLIETFNEFHERTGHTILERYGMSETCMLTSNPYDAADRGERRGGTVGFPLPASGARRDDKGDACAVDEIGGIQVRAQCVWRLLAHAGKEQGRVHHGWLVQDRRRRQDRCAAAT